MTELVVNGHKINDETTFKFKPNPKRANSKAHDRYEAYQTATNISEYLEVAESKFAKADLRYDVEHGHLQLIGEDGTVLNAKQDEPEDDTDHNDQKSSQEEF